MKQTGLSFRDLHWPMIAVVVFIALLGSYNLHSAAAADDPHLFATQLMWFGLGVFVVAATLMLDYRLSESVAYPIYIFVCLLLVGVLATGKAAMGARRWLVLGPLTFQPSELAKLATVLCLARYFSLRNEHGPYTLYSLLRPFNVSRPLALLALVMLSWSKPWMADPLGEFARSLRIKLAASPPVLENLMWFRGVVCVAWGLLILLSVWLIQRFDKKQVLLNAWSRVYKKRVLIALAVLAAAGFAGIVYVWNTPFLQDPMGYAITALYESAAPGGSRSVLVPGMLLRGTLIVLCFVYFSASVMVLRGSDVKGLTDMVVAPIDVVAVPAGLVLVQPDLGTAGIIMAIGMTMMLVVGIEWRSLIILGLMGSVLSFVAWFGVLKDYQKRRILTFIDPEHDIKGAGWNAVQSMIAVGSGRWFGKGHRGGTQTQLSFLPEQHTDFAFSVWAEEQGFIGSALVVILYWILATFAFAIAADARDSYGSLLATGMAALMLWQALINMGMVIGVFPVVGITLPLFSYGGTSVMAILFGVGLLLNVHLRRRA